MPSPLYENLPDNINKNKRNLPDKHSDLVWCVGWHENRKWDLIEISSDLKVYPCCTLHAEHQLEKTFFDEKLDAMEDGWNDLKKHSLKDILKIWREYITPEKWKNENTLPQCCGRLCRAE